MSRQQLRSPDETVARTAAARYGLVRHADAVAAGLTDHQIRTRITSRGWQRLVRGVYALPGSRSCWQRDALAGCLATDGLASHVTSGALRGVVDPSLVPHVTVPPASSTRTPRVRIHRSPVLLSERDVVQGVPCTNLARTVVDLAAVVDRQSLERIVDDVLADARFAITPADLHAAVAGVAGGRRGLGLLRSTLQVWAPEVLPESPAEIRLLRLVEAWALPRPTPQHEVHRADGSFVARLDLAWPERRVGLEYDSVRWHGPRRWAHDEQRHEAVRAQGWELRSVTKADLLPGAERQLLDWVRSRLLSRAA